MTILPTIPAKRRRREKPISPPPGLGGRLSLISSAGIWSLAASSVWVKSAGLSNGIAWLLTAVFEKAYQPREIRPAAVKIRNVLKKFFNIVSSPKI
jgi:hypothetical protein